MKRLLIVVDFQNDFVDGALGFPGAEKLEGSIVSKIKEYLASGDEIVYTQDSHSKNYLKTQEGKNLPVEHCIEGTFGEDFYGKIAELAPEDDHIFVKSTFGSINLVKFLARKQQVADEADVLPFSTIELVGLVSNLCVLSNAVVAKTVCPEVPIIVDAQLTDSYDKGLHEKSLDIMEGLQIKVLNR